MKNDEQQQRRRKAGAQATAQHKKHKPNYNPDAAIKRLHKILKEHQTLEENMAHPTHPQYPTITNPESVGNPDIEPIIRVDKDTAEFLTNPENGGCTHCNGINWCHQPHCPKAHTP
jgi:hypothetical protein